jgi:hypothetical protein
MAKLDVLLAVCRELRPVLRHRRGGFDQAPINEHEAGQRGDVLGRREHVDYGVLAPRDCFGRVGMAAPDVDDELAVDVDRDGRADFLTADDLLGERRGDLVESGIAMTVEDLMHPTIML